MATAFRKMGVYLGLVEEDDYADGGGSDAYGAWAREPQYRREEVAAVRGGYDGGGGQHLARQVDHDGYDDYELQYDPPPPRITTLHPRTYNEAKTIGLQFRGGTPVIMNLSEMDDSDAKRLVDFAAGLTFGLHGSIERVTPKVFLLSPHNVTVTAADKAKIESGFFNQS